MRRARRARRGFAMFMVLLISLIVGSFAVVLWHMGTSGKTQEEVIVEKKQAQYLAEGAQQHFLLKFRHQPTQLYDAVAYAIGKNPRFDFGRKFTEPVNPTSMGAADAEQNPGPMFYFGTVSQIDNSGPVPRIRRTVDLANPPGLDAGQIRVLIRQFLLDVATNYPTDKTDGVVVCDSEVHDDKAMGAGWRDPFMGNYVVRDARTLGQAGGRRYDKESLLVESVGSVKRAKQISLVTVFGGKPRGLTFGRRVQSDLEFGKHEFPEASSHLEDLAAYQRRVAEDGADKSNSDLIDLASGRRTEIVTAVYRVSREVK